MAFLPEAVHRLLIAAGVVHQSSYNFRPITPAFTGLCSDAGNLSKHGVSSDAAVSVFGDGLALTFSDSDHSELEDRSRTSGISNKSRLLVVVHTDRRYGIRIISARKAARYEKASMKMADQDIPELKRDELGKHVGLCAENARFNGSLRSDKLQARRRLASTLSC